MTYTPGASVQYGYDEAGRRVSEVWSTGERTDKKYDQSGRLIQVKRNEHVVTLGYDDLGRRSFISDPVLGTRTFDYANESNNQIGLKWDEHGKWTRRTNMWVEPLVTTYDDGQSSQEYRYAYSEKGDLTSFRSPAGRFWNYRYDAAGRLLGIDFPGRQSVDVKRDPHGRVTRVTRDGTMYRDYLYGPFGRLRMESSPLGIAAAYSHDETGRIKQVVEPSGPVSYRYDDNGMISDVVAIDYHIRQEHHPDGSLARKTYDTAALDLRFPLDEFARPAGIDLNDVKVSYLYDDGGRVVLIQLPDGQSIAIEHDAVGRPVKFDYGPNLVIRTSYDHEDRATEILVKTSDDESPFSETYEYDTPGNLVRHAPAGRPEKRMSYDEDSRLIGIFSRQDLVSFEYDTNDNLRAVRSREGSAEWQLDDGGRPASLGLQSSYEWDRAGNLTGQSDINAKISNTFDAAGRLLRRRVDDYEWTFGYLPDGDRLWCEGPDGRKWFAYLVDGLIGFKDESAVTWLVVNEPVTNQPLALCGSDGTTYFVIADRMGSIRRVMNTVGETIARTDYGAYGNIEANEGFSPLAVYAGMVRENHGLYYARRRYYDPGLFRFISADPLVGTPGLPGTHNAYAYASNNPFRYVDPTGTQPGERHSIPVDFSDLDEWPDNRLREEMDRSLQTAHKATSRVDQVQKGPQIAHRHAHERYTQSRRALEQRGVLEQPKLNPRRPHVRLHPDGTITHDPTGGIGSKHCRGITNGFREPLPCPYHTPRPPTGPEAAGRRAQTHVGDARPSGSGPRSGPPGGRNTAVTPTGEGGPRPSTRYLDESPRSNTGSFSRSNSPGGSSTQSIPRGTTSSPSTQRPNLPPGPDPGPPRPSRPYTSPRTGPWQSRPGLIGQTRPYTSPRTGGPWRPRAPTVTPRAPTRLSRILPRITAGRGLAAVEIGLGMIFTASEIWEISSRVNATNQGSDDRKRRDQIIRQWIQTAKDARDQRNEAGRDADFLPNVDGSIPTDTEIEQRIRRNVGNGLPPFTGILTTRGGAASRGDADKFRRDMDLANRLLPGIQDSRRNAQRLNREIQQIGLDVEQGILDAENTTGIDPEDFDKLKRDTAELNQLIQAYRDSDGSDQGSLADAFERAADEVCQSASSITKDTPTSEIERRRDDADRKLNALADRSGAAQDSSEDSRLTAIRNLANSVRSQAHELGRLLEWGEGGPDGDGRTLDSLRNKLRQINELTQERNAVMAAEETVSKQFANLVVPWMGEAEARNLWSTFTSSDDQAQNTVAGDDRIPGMAIDDMHRRLAAVQRALDKMPKDAATTIANAKKAIAAADSLEAAPKSSGGNFLEDQKRINAASTNLKQCRFDIQTKLNNRSALPPDMFRALDPTRPRSRLRSSKPVLPLIAHTKRETLRVPNLVGMTAKSAMDVLAKTGFQGLPALGREASAADQSLNVYQQTPTAGTALTKGETVKFVFYSESTDMVTVPNVIGQKQTVAKAEIARANLKPAVTMGKGKSSDSPDHVYQQSPKAGSQVAKGTTIRLMIHAPGPDHDGSYTVTGGFAELSSQFDWKQIDANTAQVTFHLNGTLGKLLRPHGLPLKATVTARKSGNRYEVPVGNPLTNAVDSASRSLNGTPSRTNWSFVFTPGDRSIAFESRGLNPTKVTATRK